MRAGSARTSIVAHFPLGCRVTSGRPGEFVQIPQGDGQGSGFTRGPASKAEILGCYTASTQITHVISHNAVIR
jgi:hypothetical protein